MAYARTAGTPAFKDSLALIVKIKTISLNRYSLRTGSCATVGQESIGKIQRGDIKYESTKVVV
jgi:hypothetical protein